jgi:hypothetical protein
MFCRFTGTTAPTVGLTETIISQTIQATCGNFRFVGNPALIFRERLLWTRSLRCNSAPIIWMFLAVMAKAT